MAQPATIVALSLCVPGLLRVCLFVRSFVHHTYAQLSVDGGHTPCGESHRWRTSHDRAKSPIGPVENSSINSLKTSANSQGYRSPRITRAVCPRPGVPGKVPTYVERRREAAWCRWSSGPDHPESGAQPGFGDLAHRLEGARGDTGESREVRELFPPAD